MVHCSLVQQYCCTSAHGQYVSAVQRCSSLHVSQNTGRSRSSYANVPPFPFHLLISYPMPIEWRTALMCLRLVGWENRGYVDVCR